MGGRGWLNEARCGDSDWHRSASIIRGGRGFDWRRPGDYRYSSASSVRGGSGQLDENSVFLLRRELGEGAEEDDRTRAT